MDTAMNECYYALLVATAILNIELNHQKQGGTDYAE